MGKINVLGFEIANLIAAGVVVDRPASVMKELLENAIDAGATKVTAEIRGGGVLSIRVSDNGCGMSPEDLPVALRRHATSKIHSAEDLTSIATLGFRGEALAAISSVSEVTIVSKTKDAETGTMLTSDGGTVTDLTEVGATDGTTVLVEHLFARVPARRKFLKRDLTEAQACAAQMEKVAMSHPEIAFRFVSDGTLKFSTAGDGDPKNVLWALYGREFASRLLAVSCETDGVGVTGFVGRSDNSHGNRNMQNVFINGRFVKSKTVTAALERAFTSYLAPERYPVSALYLSLDPRQVDVNVHPAKLEVRFSDERRIFDAVYWAVRAALEENTERPELSLRDSSKTARALSGFADQEGKSAGEQMRMPPPLPKPGAMKNAAPAAEEGLSPAASLDFLGEMRRATDAILASAPAPVAPSDTPGVKEVPVFRAASPFSPSAARDPRPETPPRLPDTETPVSGAASPASPIVSEPVTAVAPPSPESEAVPPPASAVPAPAEAKPERDSASPGEAAAGTDAPLPPYRYIGCAFRCYLLVELEDELLVIDQHAAHERILFERLLATQRAEGRIPRQELLIPLTVPLTREESAAVLEAQGELEDVGFTFAPTRDGLGVALTALPNAVSPAEALDLFTKMAGDLVSAAGTPGMTDAKRRERALYQVACKAAVKGGRVYSEEQLIHLVEEVLRLPDVTVCPHGRPIAYRLTKRELDRRFDRIK